MNPSDVVDLISAPLQALGWKPAEVATSLEPDTERTEVPLPLVLRGPVKAQGDSRYDNFVAQVERQYFGIQISCLRDELDQRRAELSGALLGKQLPGNDFDIQFQEGKPLVFNRTIEWWLDMYFIDFDRRQSS